MHLSHKQKTGKRLAIAGLICQGGPILGMLGTVIGMIAAFQNMDISGGSDPEALANNISFALITTAVGLIIAFIGVILMLSAILACDYRRPWAYVVLMILSGLTALNYPWGTLIGVPLLVFLIIHFTKYRATSLERAVMEEE